MVDVTIRQMCVEDINTDYVNWLNDPVVNKYLETKHSSFSSCLRYVKNKTLDPESMMFVILADGVMVGTCTLSSIDFVDASACLGIMVGKKEVWGKGICVKAANLLKKYAKVNLGLIRLYMSVDVDNVGAIKCYKSSGFKEVSLKMECELF